MYTLSPPQSPSSPRASAVGSSASYDPQAAYEDKESYSPDLDSLHFPLAKHIQRHHTPVSPPPPKHILLPYTPPPPPLRSTISLAPDSGDYLNALSSAVIAGIAVVLLGYACYLRRRSQSVALRARTRLSGEDNASTSAVVELEQPTASWRRDEVADTCTHLDECSSLPYTVPYGKNMNMWRTIFAQAQPLPPPV